MDQGLPVNFENTAGTWQNMPGMAAFYTGLQNQAAQDNIRMLQEAFAKEQAFKDQQRPIELQNLVATGDLTRANALYHGAQARLTGLNADFEQSTMPDKVSATKAKYKFDTDILPYKQLQEQGKTIGDLSAYVANPMVPAWDRAQKTAEIMGGNAQDYLVHMNKLPQILKAESDHRFKLSDEARLEGMKNDNAVKVAGIAAKAHTDAAEIAAKGGIEKEKEKSRRLAEASTKMATAKSASQKLAIATEEYEKARQEQDAEGMNHWGGLVRALIPLAANENPGGGRVVVRPRADGTMEFITQGANAQTNLGNTNGPKPGTAENPIKLN